ncbi:hypothetical protein BGZ94_003349 [Podila epigama]|nr:hypothetical protein BGZ94_003349 [Podila epigama]
MNTTSWTSRTPHPGSIRHSQSFEPGQHGPTAWPGSEGGLTTKRSSASLNLLSSLTTSVQGSTSPHEHDQRSSFIPVRSSGFSNPFKKLQNTFGSSNSSKKAVAADPSASLTNNSGSSNISNSGSSRVTSSSSSANSLTSWRSKGAEMLSKANWRSRKNSEPLLNNINEQQVPATPIFGATLEDAVRLSHIPGTPLVPAVLHRCAEFLEIKGVQEVGLYRVPGSHASVQRLKRMFDTGRDYDLLAMDAIDPNDIATLLKLYLRELPSPLLPATLLEQFQSLLSTDRHICHTLRGILIRLPRPNYVVLSYLCHHLSKIAAHSDTTKMTVSNLGVVFAPTLSIGSVLFKALLGGFYDGNDTPENREKGLKIVWGGLLQDIEFGYAAYDDDDDENAVGEQKDQETTLDHHFSRETGIPTGPPIVVALLQVSAVDPSCKNSSAPDSEPRGAYSTTHVNYTPGQHTPHFRPSTPKDEEERLMSAMMMQEENAVKGSQPYPHSDLLGATPHPLERSSVTTHSTYTANTSSLFATSTTASPSSAVATTTSLTAASVSVPASGAQSGAVSTTMATLHSCGNYDVASRPRDHTYLQGQAAVTAQQHGLHISIDTGSSTQSGSFDSFQSRSKSQNTPKSASGAPQLPPLDGLSIAI